MFEKPTLSMGVPPKGKLTIKYKDVFHLEDLYKSMHWWLGEKRWIPEDGHEILYVEKVSPDGASEHIIRWEFSKDAQDSPKYFRYKLKVEFHTLAIKPQEVVVDGKKLPAVKGEVEITITPSLVLDEDKMWQKSPVWATWQTYFNKRHYKNKLEALRLELYNEMYEFQGSIKKFLQLKQFLPTADQEPFHPGRAFPT